MESSRSLLGCCLAAVLFSCASVQAPAGAKCTSSVSGGSTSAELTASLARAKAGECVVATGTAYQGNFVLPPGVKLVAQEGAVVAVSAEEPSSAAITVNGGAGSGLYGINVVRAAGNGIEVIGGPALLTKVTVRQARQAALRISCAGTDCTSDAKLIEVIDADLRDSDLGLAVFGARVRVTGGHSNANTSTRLGYGYGVVAGGGASLSIEGLQVEGNLSAGVIIDGTGGTSAQLTDVKVLSNLGRGVWAQGLNGTEAAPKLVISGAQTLIDGNRIVGLGAVASTGITVADASITNTIKVRLNGPTGGTPEDVGDGVGLFNGTGQIRLDRVVLENNQRGQVVIDKGAVGIIIPDVGRIAGGDFKVVIQNTTAMVSTSPQAISTPGRDLLVKPDLLSVPMP